eukprot:TRINITY_DN5997_c0_g2_i2.p1 TRINITY_DN5997_c0_g2~~TRINITY_DN5997_c0_g2_i2.p1  ORF type:complete len:272 (-),score=29.43 TRINITY_DN5997_c0_g2_i2:94-909(-)
MVVTSATTCFNDDDVVYLARPKAWEIFFEPGANVAKLRRCSVEPASCLVPKVALGPHNMACLDASAMLTRKVSRVDSSHDVKSSYGTVLSTASSLDVGPVTPPALRVDVAASQDPSQDLALEELTDEPITDELRSSDTTVMVRDIPCKVNYERMMSELKSLGFDGRYDFLYFPKSLRDRKSNRCFCFVNFESPDVAMLFVTKFAKFRFEGIQSQNFARVGRAMVQGRKANVSQASSARNRVQFKADAAGLRVQARGTDEVSLKELNENVAM